MNPNRARRIRALAYARERRSQSAFEYLLLIGGGVLFVILTVAVVRTSINTNSLAANNTAGGYQTFTQQRGDYVLNHDAVNASCIAYWPFSEGSGTNAEDTSGHGLNGTLTSGPTWTTSGKFGNALTFDGTDDYVYTAGNLNIAQNGSLTIAGWYKFNNLATTEGDLLYIHNLVFMHSANNYMYMNSVSGYFPTSVSSAITAGTWAHIALTYSGGEETGLLYVNGVKFDYTDQNPLKESNPAISSNFRFAGAASTYTFNGTIDEVTIYNRALTADEIAGMYRATSTWCS